MLARVRQIAPLLPRLSSPALAAPPSKHVERDNDRVKRDTRPSSHPRRNFPKASFFFGAKFPSLLWMSSHSLDPMHLPKQALSHCVLVARCLDNQSLVIESVLEPALPEGFACYKSPLVAEELSGTKQSNSALGQALWSHQGTAPWDPPPR